MAAYVDASVLLRIILRSPGRWEGMTAGGTYVSSALVRVECQRALDRLRVLREAPEAELESYRVAMNELLGNLNFIEVDPGLLHRASEPLPGVLGTLDAIHLASAKTWQEEAGKDLVFVTHDRALGKVARLMLMKVEGIPHI